ncbi:hypothetical protein AYX08_08615 [Stenotrophomonas maltophilia]|nr:hypothetical protein AYX08_08615 [Stenotrophomonas maltophilia]
MRTDFHIQTADILKGQHKAIQWIVLLSVLAAQSIGRGSDVTVGIVGEISGIGAGIRLCRQLPELVVDPAERSLQFAIYIPRLFRDAIPRIVQDEGD